MATVPYDLGLDMAAHCVLIRKPAPGLLSWILDEALSFKLP